MRVPVNQSQKEAIAYLSGPLMIVAGAGTGKTTVITEKIAYLIEQGLAKPEEILALTFTEKAAAEMQERVDQFVEIGYSDMHISTFHTFCQRLLENYGLDIGLPNRFTLLTDTDAWLLLSEHLDQFRLEYYQPLGNPLRHIHELLKHFSKCKDELITPRAYLEYSEAVALDSDSVEANDHSRLQEVAQAYHTYNQLLLQNAILDFGDLIFYSTLLLQQRDYIRTMLQQRFRFILVDEFQDVNYAQYELVKLLSIPRAQSLVQPPQLTVVGDDDQSIYAFRGASVANILQFKQDFPHTKEIVLTHNFRSGQDILDRAYTLIQHNNPNRLEEKLAINKRLTCSVQGLASKVYHHHFSTLEDEVRFVVREIAERKTENTTMRWDDFAILVRANSHAEPFMEALERRGIPYEFLTSSGLYRQPIVVDCYNILKAIDNYHDSLTMYHLLRLPCWEVDEHELVHFTRLAKQKSLPYYEVLRRARELRLPSRLIGVGETLTTLIDRGVKRARWEKPTTILLEFLQDSGYLSYLTRQEEVGNGDTIRAIRHLKQFFECIERYQQNTPRAHVAGFISFYEQLLASGDEGALYQPTDTPDSVNMITVHSAKGLEFRSVFVVNCVEQRFPSIRRRDAIEVPEALVKQELPTGDVHEQEERRLFYVALTRAKEQLYLTSAEYYEGAKRAKKVSRFVTECGFSDQQTAKKKLAEEYQIQEWGSEYGMTKKSDLTAVTYELPKTFSYSQIRAFQMCPYQYKLAYLLHIPTKQSHYFSFGNTIHVTLQRFYERLQAENGARQASLFGEGIAAITSSVDGIRAPAVEELLQLYDNNWIEDWYQSKQQRETYYKRGKAMLQKFYATHHGQWTIPVALEKGFKMNIGGHLVTGKIDRIDQRDDGTLHIIDYKTGEAKEEVSGSDKDQLLLYQLAALRVPFFRQIGKPSQLTYYYINGGVLSSFLGSEKELNTFEVKMVETIEEILATNWSQIGRKDACGRCEFCHAAALRRR